MASLPILLKPPDRRGGTLSVLKGLLQVEVAVRPQELVAVPDLARAQRKTFRGAEDYQLHIEAVQPAGNVWSIHLQVIGPPGWQYDSNRYGMELIDARGRLARFQYLWLQSSPLRKPQPEDLAWFMAAPLASSLVQLPWPTLARQRGGGERLEWRGTIQHYSPVEFVSPVKLRFYPFDRLKAELPFELRDVPLP